jgi:CYTH domain-containing protein
VIENELKYVLRIDSMEAIEKICGKPTSIQQGYLPGKARIRSKGKGKKTKYFFTYKLPVDDMLFEIEKEITQHEFETLWPYTVTRLDKVRYLFMDNLVQWDIDFFRKANGELYFAMAEAEMPETMREPTSIPAFLQAAMVYPVPRERTKEFTSQKVADPAYAEALIF